jgi:HEPN domain-containing protein
MKERTMKHFRWAVLSGFGVWLAPFVAGVALSGVRANDRIFFETLMPIVLSVTAVVFLVIRPKAAASVGAGLVLGMTWLVISICLDLLMFMWGPMKMSFIDYTKDIGLAYLMYPVIAAGAGWLSQKARGVGSAKANVNKPRSADSFLEIGEGHLKSAEILLAHNGCKRDVVFLLHASVEMSLKAILIVKGIWDGHSDELKKHPIQRLVEELVKHGVGVPPDLCKDLVPQSQVPRVGEGPCESSVQSRYADNLDWNAISIKERLGVAKRILEYANAEINTP